MNRAQATIELIKRDSVTPGRPAHGLDRFQNGLIKVHDGISGIGPSITGLISKNRFQVMERTSPVSGTINSIQNTLRARWFAKGNPLNILAKAVTGFMELPDGPLSDALHLGGKGHIVKAVD